MTIESEQKWFNAFPFQRILWKKCFEENVSTYQRRGSTGMLYDDIGAVYTQKLVILVYSIGLFRHLKRKKSKVHSIHSGNGVINLTMAVFSNVWWNKRERKRKKKHENSIPKRTFGKKPKNKQILYDQQNNNYNLKLSNSTWISSNRLIITINTLELRLQQTSCVQFHFKRTFLPKIS